MVAVPVIIQSELTTVDEHPIEIIMQMKYGRGV